MLTSVIDFLSTSNGQASIAAIVGPIVIYGVMVAISNMREARAERRSATHQ